MGNNPKIHIKREVLIAENGSTDGSQKIATDLGVRVVQVQEKDYGSALMGGVPGVMPRFVSIRLKYDFCCLYEKPEQEFTHALIQAL